MFSENPISHNFKSSAIENANLFEKTGMKGMSLAARLTRPIEYVGYSKAAGLIRTFLPSKRSVRTRLFEDTLFEYPYGDGYWSRLAYNGDVYARNEEDFLKAMRDVDFAYIDCGANFGYMSSIITSEAYGRKPSIAIEADPKTFKMLEHNASLNANRFEIRHNAIYSKSGEMVNVHGDKHEARSILDESGNREDGNVETLALDDLSGWVKQQDKEALILKLDVEGVEIEALKGAGSLLNAQTLIMFEDHANDKTHEVSSYLMNDLGMRIFYSEKGGCRELTAIDEVAKVKVNPRVGYDFLATRSEFWVKHIQNCRY